MVWVMGSLVWVGGGVWVVSEWVGYEGKRRVCTKYWVKRLGCGRGFRVGYGAQTGFGSGVGCGLMNRLWIYGVGYKLRQRLLFKGWVVIDWVGYKLRKELCVNG